MACNSKAVNSYPPEVSWNKCGMRGCKKREFEWEDVVEEGEAKVMKVEFEGVEGEEH